MLTEAGDEVDQIYFPHYGMLSLLAVLRDGKAIETATVGREGVVGAMAGLGLLQVAGPRRGADADVAAAGSPPAISGRSPPAAIPFAISASATTRCCCRRRG